MNDDNVVSLKLPPKDPELIEKLRILLSEAQNGRLTEFAAVYIADESVSTVLHFSEALQALGAIELLSRDVLDCLDD